MVKVGKLQYVKWANFIFTKWRRNFVEVVCVCVIENNIQGELFDFRIYCAGLLFEVHPIAKVCFYRCKDLQMSI